MINDYSQSLLNYQREFQQTKALGLSVPNIQRLVPIADQLAVIDPSQFQGAWRAKFLRMSHDQVISEITKVLNQPPFKK